MRLWHEKLIPHLPRQQLFGQHRECCVLRGNGWGRKHATVDYVFKHPYEWLFEYHDKVMQEMFDRGYQYDPEWQIPIYRGKNAPCHTQFDTRLVCAALGHDTIYPEHNDEYLKACLDNLEHKGIHIEMRDQHAD